MLKSLTRLIILLIPISFTFGNAAIDIAVSSLSLLFILIAVRNKDFNNFKEVWFISFLIFWLYIVSCSLFSIDVLSSIKATLPFIRFPIFAIALASILQQEPDMKLKLFLVLSLVLIVMFIGVIMQLTIGYDFLGNRIVIHNNFFRLVTFAGKQRIGYVSAFLTIPLLGFYFDLILKKSQTTLFSLLILSAVFLGFIMITLSGERMALAISIAAVFFGLLSLQQYRRKVLISFSLISMLVIGGILITPQLKDRLLDQSIAQITTFNSDQYGKIYKLAWDFFLKNPKFGIGSNQYLKQCYKAKETAEISPSFRCAIHPHNWYLQTFAENGFLGGFLFIFTVIAIILKLLKNKYEYYGYFAAVLAVTKFVPFVPSSSLYAVYSQAPLWFAMGLALSCIPRK